MKRTEEQQVKKDVINYLENKYNEKFEIAEIQWICNAAVGCPDAHVLSCYPLNNPDLKFRIDVFYGDILEIQRDEYKDELLDYDAEQELEKLVKSKFKFQQNINISTGKNRLNKYLFNKIKLEEVVNDYPDDIHMTINLYLLESKEEKRQDYVGLINDILLRFASLPFKNISLNIYFYNEHAYVDKTPEEIKEIFNLNVGSFKDFKNSRKKWALQIENKDLKNIDYVIENIEDFINEYKYNETQE